VWKNWGGETTEEMWKSQFSIDIVIEIDKPLM